MTIPTAIITNGSLLWRDEVAQAASLEDFLSITAAQPLRRRLEDR